MCTDSPEVKVTHVCRTCWMMCYRIVGRVRLIGPFLCLYERNRNSMKCWGLHMKTVTYPLNTPLPFFWSKCSCCVNSYTVFSLFITNWCFVTVSHWDVNAVDSHWSYLENERTVHDGVSNADVTFFFRLRIKIVFLSISPLYRCDDQYLLQR